MVKAWLGCRDSAKNQRLGWYRNEPPFERWQKSKAAGKAMRPGAEATVGRSIC